MVARFPLASLLAVVLLAGAVSARADDPKEESASGTTMRAMVRADWEAQEKRLGRSPDSPEAIHAVQ